jgi:hypothetical protein
MCGQGTTACPTLRHMPPTQLRIPLFGLGVSLGDRLLGILEP